MNLLETLKVKGRETKSENKSTSVTVTLDKSLKEMYNTRIDGPLDLSFLGRIPVKRQTMPDYFRRYLN